MSLTKRIEGVLFSERANRYWEAATVWFIVCGALILLAIVAFVLAVVGSHFYREVFS